MAGPPVWSSLSVRISFLMMRRVLAVLSFVGIVATLTSGWDQFGLVLVGKEIISLQSLCCLHVGPPTWAEFWQFFLKRYLPLSPLLMSIFIPNNITSRIIDLWWTYDNVLAHVEGYSVVGGRLLSPENRPFFYVAYLILELRFH